MPVRLRVGHRFHETAVLGHPEGAELRRVVEWPWRVVPVADDGVVLADALARKLGVSVGDTVSVEVLEGDRRVRTALVTGIVGEVFGMMAHMQLPALHRMLGQEPAISTVLLRIDPAVEDVLDQRLKRFPKVASVGKRAQSLELFRRQSAENMRVTSVILTLFGCAIAVAIVYNNARIALSVRGRDLASLRVLGFTRREISGVLLGGARHLRRARAAARDVARKGARRPHDVHRGRGNLPAARRRLERDVRVRRRHNAPSPRW